MSTQHTRCAQTPNEQPKHPSRRLSSSKYSTLADSGVGAAAVVSQHPLLTHSTLALSHSLPALLTRTQQHTPSCHNQPLHSLPLPVGLGTSTTCHSCSHLPAVCSSSCCRCSAPAAAFPYTHSGSQAGHAHARVCAPHPNQPTPQLVAPAAAIALLLLLCCCRCCLCARQRPDKPHRRGPAPIMLLSSPPCCRLHCCSAAARIASAGRQSSCSRPGPSAATTQGAQPAHSVV